MRRLVVALLCVVLGLTMAGCPDDKKVDPTPRDVPTQPWTPEPENKVGTAEFGAYCDGKEGQSDYTATGIPVECRKNPGEGRPRWRNAR